MMKKDYYSEIRVWKGRAYLHEEFESFGLPTERDTPLGTDPKYIDKVRAFHDDCKVVFLKDDFTPLQEDKKREVEE